MKKLICLLLSLMMLLSDLPVAESDDAVVGMSRRRNC